MSVRAAPTELSFLTIAQAAELIKTRKVSPVELTQALLNRIETLDSQVNAFITLTPELALRQASETESEISAGRYRGPMHGIPFGLKDIYNTAGTGTTAHWRIYADNVPRDEARTTAMLYSAGAVLLGKLGTHEFAIGDPSHDLPWPIPRNPWQREHYVGGSSSGSAAAVAAGFALGTDTGASIRDPAALAGIAVLKPTYGFVSCRGVIPNSYSFDNCGPMAWTVDDCAILLQAIASYDPRDSASVSSLALDYRAGPQEHLRGVCVGVIRHFWKDYLAANENMCRATDDALHVLAKLGATLEDARVRPMRGHCADRGSGSHPALPGAPGIVGAARHRAKSAARSRELAPVRRPAADLSPSAPDIA